MILGNSLSRDDLINYYKIESGRAFNHIIIKKKIN